MFDNIHFAYKFGEDSIFNQNIAKKYLLDVNRRNIKSRVKHFTKLVK